MVARKATRTCSDSETRTRKAGQQPGTQPRHKTACQEGEATNTATTMPQRRLKLPLPIQWYWILVELTTCTTNTVSPGNQMTPQYLVLHLNAFSIKSTSHFYSSFCEAWGRFMRTKINAGSTFYSKVDKELYLASGF